VILSQEILETLRTAPLFQGVSAQALVQKLSESTLRVLSSGEILLAPNQPSNVIYIILSGRLRIQQEESSIESVALLGAGESVGEMAIIGDVNIPAYVIAATDCKLLVIDNATLWELIDSSHQAAHNVLSVLSMRIRPASQAMSENLESHHGFSGTPMVDEMTGLYNRQWIADKINRYLRRQAFDKQPNCLMIVAIDRFDELENKYGQIGGEQILRDTARTILACLRPDDQAGRFYGKQFAVFMPQTTLADGCIAAERLKTAISKSVIVLPSGDALPPISVSLGIVLANLDDTPASLFARAIDALRQALAA
jgi:diguanylate cyclase (GGDEF)-like protein